MKIVVETDARVTGCDVPTPGEIWLRVDTGMLYEMREWVAGTERNGPYRACHRVDAPESGYGCGPTVHCACFDSDVVNGKWIRVMNCPELKKC